MYCSAYMALHAYTHCDTTSSFKGIGKIKPQKKLSQNPIYYPIFASLGDSWDVSDELMNKHEEFTCLMYSSPQYKTVDEVRYAILIRKCGSGEQLNSLHNMDVATLPPCRKFLEQQIKRVNYQVAIWKRSNELYPHIPPPEEDHGWMKGEDGMVEPLWIRGSILQTELTDSKENTMEIDRDESDTDAPCTDTLYDQSDSCSDSD